MARNGSGTFTKAVVDFVFDTVISETDMNTLIDDISTEMTNSVAVDGQSTMTGALHLTAGSLTGDAATIRQIQDGAMSYVASDTGSANAYAIALSPAVASYIAGLVVHFIPANNSTGASTINVSALGTRAIQIQGAAVGGANITTTGICSLIYDGTQFQMFSLDKVNTAATIGLILALGG